MRITILAVGRLKEDYLREASDFFSASLNKLCSFSVIEIPDEKNTAGSETQVKNTEGRGILNRIRPDQYVIALAIDGKPLTTSEFRNKIRSISENGKDDIVLVIGGSLGLSDEVLKRSDYRISFSPMTFPHQLMRIMLMEQLYTVLK